MPDAQRSAEHMWMLLMCLLNALLDEKDFPGINRDRQAEKRYWVPVGSPEVGSGVSVAGGVVGRYVGEWRAIFCCNWFIKLFVIWFLRQSCVDAYE